MFVLCTMKPNNNNNTRVPACMHALTHAHTHTYMHTNVHT